jgi:hypothetical protein
MELRHGMSRTAALSILLLLALPSCGGPAPSASESIRPESLGPSTTVECQLEPKASCDAIAEAAAEQLPVGAVTLLIHEAMYCDSTMLGPACDRPPLEHMAGVLVTLADGQHFAYNAWRAETGEVLLFDDQPRANESNPYAP